MVNRLNFKVFIHNWLDYKEEDNTNRPVWIDNWLKNYENGKWGVGLK